MSNCLAAKTAYVKNHRGQNNGSYSSTSQSQWPRGLRRASAAARWLGLRVRIPPGHVCLSILSVVCGQVEFSPHSV